MYEGNQTDEPWLISRVDDVTDPAGELARRLEAARDIKRFCRRSDANVSVAWNSLFSKLHDSDSRVRLHALRLVSELALRSRHLRGLLADSLPVVTALVVGGRSVPPPPPPAEEARELRDTLQSSVDRLAERYGARHYQFALAKIYLAERGGDGGGGDADRGAPSPVAAVASASLDHGEAEDSAHASGGTSSAGGRSEPGVRSSPAPGHARAERTSGARLRGALEAYWSIKRGWIGWCRYDAEATAQEMEACFAAIGARTATATPRSQGPAARGRGREAYATDEPWPVAAGAPGSGGERRDGSAVSANGTDATPAGGSRIASTSPGGRSRASSRAEERDRSPESGRAEAAVPRADGVPGVPAAESGRAEAAVPRADGVPGVPAAGAAGAPTADATCATEEVWEDLPPLPASRGELPPAPPDGPTPLADAAPPRGSRAPALDLPDGPAAATPASESDAVVETLEGLTRATEQRVLPWLSDAVATLARLEASGAWGDEGARDDDGRPVPVLGRRGAFLATLTGARARLERALATYGALGLEWAVLARRRARRAEAAKARGAAAGRGAAASPSPDLAPASRSGSSTNSSTPSTPTGTGDAPRDGPIASIDDPWGDWDANPRREILDSREGTPPPDPLETRGSATARAFAALAEDRPPSAAARSPSPAPGRRPPRAPPVGVGPPPAGRGGVVLLARPPPDAPDPYERIRDPAEGGAGPWSLRGDVEPSAAADRSREERREEHRRGGQAAGRPPSARAGSSGGAQGGGDPPHDGPAPAAPRDSGSVLLELAKRAPLLPTGAHTAFWERGSAARTSGRAEVYNHWGAVDVHHEIPDERFDEVFLLPSELLDRSKAELRRREDGATRESGEREGTTAPVGASRPPRAAPASRLEALPPPPRARPTPRALAADAAAFQEGRTGRAAERAFNEAVISSLRDEPAVGPDGPPASAGPSGSTAAAARKKKAGPSARERLGKKLKRAGG